MAETCIITTCMGRLAQLRQSLPSFTAQPGASVVVVDYSCPQRCGDWVETNHPEAKVVRVLGRRHFNVSHARNVGAAAAGTPWLCFLDCDKVASPDFIDHVSPLLKPGTFHNPLPVTPWVGLLICSAADFERVGRYDEVLEGWGGEDIDLRQRLKLAKITHGGFPRTLLTELHHDEADRVAHYRETDSFLSNQINLAYVSIKLDLLRGRPRLVTPGYRRRLYRKVQSLMRRALELQEPLTLNLDLGGGPIHDLVPVFVTYRYTIHPPQRPELAPGEDDSPAEP